MRQNPVGEPAATAALNFGTPRRRSSLKRLCPFCHCRQRYERTFLAKPSGDAPSQGSVRKHVAQHDGVVATDLLSELRRIAREGPITLVYSARDERAYMACSSAAERPVLKQTTVAYLSIAAEGPGSIALFDTRPRSAESLAARLRQHYPALRVAIRDNDPAGYDLLVNATAASSRAIALLRNRKFVDSLLEDDGFELLVRGRGESGCRAPVVHVRGRG